MNPLGIEVLDANGERTRVIMGCYGIGVERAMAAQSDDADTAKAGEDLYARLTEAGVETIIDDRPERAGVKFRDAELVGIPLRITVGKRGLAEGTGELTTRETGETVKIAVSDVVDHAVKLLEQADA